MQRLTTAWGKWDRWRQRREFSQRHAGILWGAIDWPEALYQSASMGCERITEPWCDYRWLLWASSFLLSLLWAFALLRACERVCKFPRTVFIVRYAWVVGSCAHQYSDFRLDYRHQRCMSICCNSIGVSLIVMMCTVSILKKEWLEIGMGHWDLKWTVSVAGECLVSLYF